MKFSNILNLMKTEYGIEIFETRIHIDEEIYNIGLLEDGIIEGNNTLFIGSFDDININSKGINMIIGIKKPNKDTNILLDSLESFVGSALINESQILKALQAANKIIYKELQGSKEVADLMLLTMKGADLKTILIASEKKLLNPIIIVDAGFKILETSSKESIDDPIWRKNIERGYCSYEFIKEVHNLEKIGCFPDNSNVFEVICKFSLYRKICSKMFLKNQLVGYVIMIEKTKVKDKLYKEYLPFVGSATCEILLRTQSHKGIFISQRETLLYELIHGGEADLIHIRLKMNQMKFPDIMGCLMVKSNEYLNNMQATKFLKEQIEYIFPSSYCVIDEENIIIICKLQLDGKLKSDEERRLHGLFEKGASYILISNPCTDISGIKEAYNQTKQLYKISTRMRIKKEIIYFSKFDFYAMLSNMNEQELMQYSHPALKVLRDYDYSHNGELYFTLQALIDCQFNMKKTADILSIHRNSLSYRLNKILDLTKVDLTDKDEIFRLSYGFKIENYCLITR